MAESLGRRDGSWRQHTAPPLITQRAKRGKTESRLSRLARLNTGMPPAADIRLARAWARETHSMTSSARRRNAVGSSITILTPSLFARTSSALIISSCGMRSKSASAVLGLTHCTVLFAPAEDAFGHRPARLRDAIALVPRGASVDGAAATLAG